jgi:tetratricopeptide (TPR) repeat protein
VSRRRVERRPPEAARGRPGAPRPARKPPEPPRPAPALPLSHPAHIAALLVAAGCVLWSVTYKLVDSDLWQHLAVGRAIWTLHSIPHTQIWCWPGYGAPYVTPSWAFAALIWPFYTAAGVTGLFAWRWLTTLAVFALLWATARRMGARGLTPLFVLAVAALIYRARSQVRPEMLASVLFALELWILETRRSGVRDHSLWLVPIAWVWANVHISYPLAFVLLGIHDAGEWAGAWLSRRRAAARPSSASAVEAATRQPAPLGRDAWIALAMAAIAFVNPYGWRTLAEPFQYFFVWRHEPIYKTVSELESVSWLSNLTNGLPLFVVGWPLLILWRARRGALDLAEALLAVYLIATALPAQRFTGLLALGASPYLARDLDAWVRARHWPRWTAAAPARALLVALACVGSGLYEWSDPAIRQGIGLRDEWFPIRASDFVAAHGVGGRAFNDYYLGGYMLWRFWPERDRLPFMDIHQTGTREDRRLAAALTQSEGAWRELDAKYAFDYVMLNRYWIEGDRSLDGLDADTSFALVFMDDAAALYLRRAGRFHALADSFAYRVLPGSVSGIQALGPTLAADSTRRSAAAAELQRMIRESPFTGSAHNNFANIAMIEGRLDEARREILLALALDPGTPYAHERLGLIALSEGRPRAALDALAREHPTKEHRPITERLKSEARVLLRETEARRRELEAALGREPGRRDLADSLAAVEQRLAR